MNYAIISKDFIKSSYGYTFSNDKVCRRFEKLEDAQEYINDLKRNREIKGLGKGKCYELQEYAKDARGFNGYVWKILEAIYTV